LEQGITTKNRHAPAAEETQVGSSFLSDRKNGYQSQRAGHQRKVAAGGEVVSVNEEKVEFLKVWYALFCTLVDAHVDGEYTDSQLVSKLYQLRNSLTTRMPEVEAELLRQQGAKHG
jgi:hypothetical protein